MRSVSRWNAMLVVGLGALGCISEGAVGAAPTANVEGVYTVTLRYGENGCLLDSWTEGAELTGVLLEMEQDGTEVTGTVPGLTGGILSLIHGSNVYRGTVEGARVRMTIFGENPGTEGNCVYSLNNEVDATFDGDFVSGTLAFVKKGNGNPDCAAVECRSPIEFNGARPPE